MVGVARRTRTEPRCAYIPPGAVDILRSRLRMCVLSSSTLSYPQLTTHSLPYLPPRRPQMRAVSRATRARPPPITTVIWQRTSFATAQTFSPLADGGQLPCATCQARIPFSPPAPNRGRLSELTATPQHHHDSTTTWIGESDPFPRQQPHRHGRLHFVRRSASSPVTDDRLVRCHVRVSNHQLTPSLAQTDGTNSGRGPTHFKHHIMSTVMISFTISFMFSKRLSASEQLPAHTKSRTKRMAPTPVGVPTQTLQKYTPPSKQPGSV